MESPQKDCKFADEKFCQAKMKQINSITHSSDGRDPFVSKKFINNGTSESTYTAKIMKQ